MLVAASLVLAHLLVDVVRPHNPGARLRVHQGLLAWDGGWYQAIAAHGYAAAGQESVRFFPPFPLAGRVLGLDPGGAAWAPALVLSPTCAPWPPWPPCWSWSATTSATAALARRSVWLLALAPSAYRWCWATPTPPCCCARW